jgi:citrate lyase subunit beta / citryl-CoA lyase
MLIRSVLFAPATRPELLGKFARCGPDVAVIDLEDAVPAGVKAATRAALTEVLRSAPSRGRLFVRINAIGSPWWVDDIVVVEQPSVAGLVVPKFEREEDLDLLIGELAPRRRALPIIAGIETVLGVLDVRRLLKPPVIGAYFGGEDLLTELGSEGTPAGDELLYARSRVALAAHAAHIAPIDRAITALDDEAGFRGDARVGMRLGYRGKICIHPQQVAWAHSAFAPGPAEVERSRGILAAYDGARETGHGVVVYEGSMVDRPMVERARAVLARAEFGGTGSD